LLPLLRVFETCICTPAAAEVSKASNPEDLQMTKVKDSNKDAIINVGIRAIGK
jgi:hypothetical protein